MAQREDPEAAAAEVWPVVEAALEEAIGRIQSMRADEGKALRADLLSRAETIETALGEVERLAPERVPTARERLHAKFEDLLGDNRLNPDRLEQEIAVIADKLDVTEECVRLRSHLVLFREALGAEEPVGRRLNFLAQEFNREINTIGSKANDAEIAALSVTMKEELEKIREQVQNVV